MAARSLQAGALHGLGLVHGPSEVGARQLAVAGRQAQVAPQAQDHRPEHPFRLAD